MQPATPAFLDAVRNGGRAVTIVDVLVDGLPKASSIPVVSGRVSMNASAQVRRSADLVVAGGDWVPRTVGDVLAPYGAEVQIRRGFVLSGGLELVSLGIFQIRSAQSKGATVRLSCLDRSAALAEQELSSGYVVRKATPFEAAFLGLLRQPGRELPFPFRSEVDARYTLPALLVPAGAKRWVEAQAWARSFGAEAFFDGTGTLVLRYLPTFSSPPVWTVDEGPNGVLIDADVNMTRAGLFNRYTLRVANPQTVGGGERYAIAEDLDPTSPTYIYGSFGIVDRSESSDLLGSTAYLQIIADRVLQGQLGGARSVSGSAVPNFALEEGDPVLIRRNAIGVNEVHVIETLEMGLGPADVMTFTTRARTVPASM